MVTQTSRGVRTPTGEPSTEASWRTAAGRMSTLVPARRQSVRWTLALMGSRRLVAHDDLVLGVVLPTAIDRRSQASGGFGSARCGVPG